MQTISYIAIGVMLLCLGGYNPAPTQKLLQQARINHLNNPTIPLADVELVGVTTTDVADYPGAFVLVEPRGEVVLGVPWLMSFGKRGLGVCVRLSSKVECSKPKPFSGAVRYSSWL